MLTYRNYPTPLPYGNVVVILLFQRKRKGRWVWGTVTVSHPYDWRRPDPQFPGGKVEILEPLERAARREVRRETGMNFPISLFHVLEPLPYRPWEYPVLAVVQESTVKKALRNAKQTQTGEIPHVLDLEAVRLPSQLADYHKPYLPLAQDFSKDLEQKHKLPHVA